MWFGARAARGARRGAQIAEGAEREAQGRSRSRTSGAMRRAAAESANAHEGDDEGERGNGRTNGGAEQGGSESNYQRPLSVVIHGPVSSFFVGTQVVYNGDGGQGRDAGNGEHSKSKSPVKELKEKHKIDADTGACNGDTGASPEFIILEKSCSVFGHAEAHNGAATNVYYDPAEGSHAMGGEESDDSCSSNCSSDCSDDSSCSRERGKGGGHREKRGGGGGGDSGDLIDFQFVSASGESEGSTWIEAVHLVLPPVIPRSSSEATWDALQAPNGTAGMEPILDGKWEAGFKGTKRAFACLLLLGCLLYIAAFLSGIIVNSTTSMLTSQTLWIAMSYLILYLVIASLGLAGSHYNNVSMMTLYILIQTTVTIISVLDSIRPFLLFCILLILLAIHIRFHMLSMELAERRLLARLVGRPAPPPRTDTWPYRLRMFPGSFSDMLKHTPVSRFRASGDPWYQETVVRYRRRAEEERDGVRESNARGRGGEVEEGSGVTAVGVGREEGREQQGQQREQGRSQHRMQQHIRSRLSSVGFSPPACRELDLGATALAAEVGSGYWLATSGSMAACSVNLKRVALLWIISNGFFSACVAGDVPSSGRRDAMRTSRELSDGGGGAGGPFNVFPAQSYLNVFNFNIPLPRLPQLPFPLKDKLKDKFNKFHKSPPPSPPPPSPSPPPPPPPPPKKNSPPPPKKSPPPPEKKSPPPPEKKSPPPPEHKSPPPPKHKSPPPPEKKSPPPPEHKSPPPPKHKSPPPPEKKSPPPPEHKSPPPPEHKSPPPPEKKSPPPPEHKSPPPPKHKSPPPPKKKSPPPPEKKSPPPPSPSPPPPPPPPPRKPSKKDHLIIILLKGAAVLVRKAHGILPPGNDAQKEELWDVVTALGDAEVLINEGRRELVQEQLDNSVVTLEEVGGELQGGWLQEQAAGGMIGLARVEIMKAQALFQ
ncbi:unnamed protein product [Closterium sp. Naga37s-1]|nr:unnamed protein product [Closterium sp. Naga37s-1]